MRRLFGFGSRASASEPSGSRNSVLGLGGSSHHRPSIQGERAKEEAARLTREADIRRLAEAGTQREVLEQLYNADEVSKVIAQFEQEQNLLKLLEEEQEKEKQQQQQQPSEPEITKAAPPAGEHVEGKSNREQNEDDQGGGVEHEDVAIRNPEKFKLRFGTKDDSEEDGIGLVADTPLASGGSSHKLDLTKQDKDLDVSLDEVNMMMDSVRVNDDDSNGIADHGKDDGSDALGSFHEEESQEDDLLKELLKPDDDESSNVESVSTNEDDFRQQSHSSIVVGGTVSDGERVDSSDQGVSLLEDLSEIPSDAPLITIETPSGFGDQSALTISIGSHERNADGSDEESAPAEKAQNSSSEEPHSDREGDGATKGSHTTSEDKSGSVETPVKAGNVGGNGTELDETVNNEKTEPEVESEQKAATVDEDDNHNEGDNEGSSTPDSDMIVQTPIEDSNEMDADLEVEAVTENDACYDAMDDQEPMEITSVEDDDELSAQSSPSDRDEEMNDDAINSQTPEEMDDAEEIEEVVMNEPAGLEGTAGKVTIENQAEEARVSTVSYDSSHQLSIQSASEDSDDSSSSEGTAAPPPPPPEEDGTNGDATIDKVEQVEEYEEDVIEEVVEEHRLQHSDEEYEEVIDDGKVHDIDGGDVKEEEVIEEVEEATGEEEYVTEEEVVSDDESEYADQVVESWHDVIESEPEDLEAAVSALIAVVYKDEDVDVEKMLRRTRLPELYKYLKQQYWYKIHTNQEVQAEAAAVVQQEQPSAIVTVDEMLKGRLNGLIGQVQENTRRMDQSISDHSKRQADDHALDESQKRESRMQSLIANVEMSSRSLQVDETRRASSSMLGAAAGEDDEEEEILPPTTDNLNKNYISNFNKGVKQSRGHHVAKEYEKAVNNRVRALSPARSRDELDNSESVKANEAEQSARPSVQDEELPNLASIQVAEAPSGSKEGEIFEEVVEEHQLQHSDDEYEEVADGDKAQKEVIEEVVEQTGEEYVTEEEVVSEDESEVVVEEEIEVVEESESDGEYEEVVEEQ